METPLALAVGPLELGLLVATAFLAGLIDAIAGGGGLLTLPALLAVGLPPHLALGTNKGQSVFGSSTALFRYARAGLVDFGRARWTFPLGLLGALAGAALVLVLDPAVLKPLVLVLLVLAGAVMAFRRTPKVVEARVVARAAAKAAVIALVIGLYDGFFGPGTGTFLILAFVSVLGVSLPNATADAKVVNFASNLASVALFGVRGVVLWKVALPMAAGQLAGGYLGAHLAVRGGDKLIRGAVLLVVLCLVVKLGVDLLRG